MQQSGQIFVITAPSGTGKTTLIRAVRDKVSAIGYCVSHTTRKPRSGELNGTHYHFVTRKEFEQMIDAHRFVEWAHVYGHLYGTSYSSMESELSSGEDLLLDLDIQGAEAIKRHFPESLSIFVLPPSMEVLEQRLRGRATDKGKDVDLRMKKAAKEIRRCGKYDFIVVNDDLVQTVREIGAIILCQRARSWRRYPLIKDLFHLRGA
ncbi:MAG: guanylate kinase [Deltaproteobacteria bacterium]|nr:guanylate kinase [Deltaproteobacteria bacterium]MBW2076215.1 guanylate kinase [Deltaproteobacteria bacterium]MBW2309732.1 guanylate kinase [Deltaproteobacteria bacterium]RLB31502.1 MAG: guanylate kinase [Deltaproteobacteria bacterium]